MGKTTIEDYLADAEARPVLEAWLQSEGDRRVEAAIRTHNLKNPRASEAAAKLAARLEQLEGALAASKAANEMKFHVFKKANELGVPFSLVEDIRFDDVAAADKKLAALATAVSQKKIAAMNEDMIEHSFRPGSGNREVGSGIGAMSAQELADFHSRDPTGAIAAAKRAGLVQGGSLDSQSGFTFK